MAHDIHLILNLLAAWFVYTVIRDFANKGKR